MTADPPSAAAVSPKRRAILAAATEVFAREGFRNADVQVIADTAAVGKGTVYRYFGNKEDLFWATTYHVLQRLEQCLMDSIRNLESPLRKICAIGDAYAGFFEDHPECQEVFVQGRAEFRGCVPASHREYHEELIDRFVKVFEEGVAAGELRPVDARKTIVALAAVMDGCIDINCYLKDEYTLRDITRYAVDTFLEGLRTDPSSKEQGA